MPTLAELAAAQQQNPANPWIPGPVPGAVPEAAALYAQDLAKEQAQKPIGPPAPPTPMTNAHATLDPVTPAAGLPAYSASLRDVAPNMQKDVGARVAQQKAAGPAISPQALGARPVGKPAAPVGAGGPRGTGESERGFLKEDQGLRAERAETIGERQNTERDIMDIYRAGLEDRKTAQEEVDSEQHKMKLDENIFAGIAQSDADAKHAAVEKRAAEVRAMHVDPTRWFKDKGTGGQVLAAIASAAGAFAASMPHGSGQNHAQKIIDNAVNADVEAQKGDIENAWKDLEGQVADADKSYARDQYKLHEMRMARVQAYDHGMQLIQQHMALTTDEAKITGMKNLLQDLQDKKTDLKKEDVDQRRDVWRREEASRQAQAAAAANEARKRQAFAREHAQKVALSPNSALSADAERMGISLEEAAYRQGLSIYDGDRGNGGLVRQAKEGKAGDDADTIRATNEFNQQIADLKKNPIITGTGLLDAAGAALPQRLAPGSNQSQTQLDAINTRMLQAVGKVAKDADGKPNKEMIQRIEQTYAIHLGDTPEQKEAKLTAVQDIYNALARQQGASNAPLSTKR